jgi:hypothetical protein
METTTPATNPEQVISPAPDNKPGEPKHINLKWLIIVFLIFFTILVAFLLILHFEKQKEGAELPKAPVTTPESQEGSGTTATQTPTTPEAPTSGQSATDDSYIEQVKMDIITGKREDVPLELAEQGKDKELIVAEYLYNCYLTSDPEQGTTCYDLYYLNHDADYKQQKENCEKLSAAEMTACLDKLYYDLSYSKGYDFCRSIKDDSLREECLITVK